MGNCQTEEPFTHLGHAVGNGDAAELGTGPEGEEMCLTGVCAMLRRQYQKKPL